MGEEKSVAVFEFFESLGYNSSKSSSKNCALVGFLSYASNKKVYMVWMMVKTF